MDTVCGAVFRGGALQIHCDGGFLDGRGAAVFVVHVHHAGLEGVTRLGYQGVDLPNARSALHSEISALQMATAWGKRYLGIIRERAMSGRVRFQFV